MSTIITFYWHINHSYILPAYQPSSYSTGI